ncbi:MAG: LysR family transcriptional regulator [Candidatus Riflebacteria bacterium]|nr:LysR family transcriptional regulator [Candidatus Riflebacteria bacterium]
MEIRALQAFLAVTRAGSFSKAADEESVSQPALSLTIQALERDLGCRLFHRGRGVSLTPAGERLRAHCQHLMPWLEDIRDDLAQVEGGLKGTIRPGVLESLLLYVMPGLLARFAGKHPAVTFQFVMKETADIEPAVLAGDCHFGLVSRPPVSRRLEEIRLTGFPHVLVTAAGHRGGAARLLRERPLFVLGDWQQEVLRERTDLFAKSPPATVLRPINHVAVVRQLVARGLGAAVLPAYVKGPDLRVVRAFPDLQMSVFLVRKPDRRPLAAAERFMEFLLGEFGQGGKRRPGGA